VRHERWLVNLSLRHPPFSKGDVVGGTGVTAFRAQGDC
jgi:hypothetical protein